MKLCFLGACCIRYFCCYLLFCSFCCNVETLVSLLSGHSLFLVGSYTLPPVLKSLSPRMEVLSLNILKPIYSFVSSASFSTEMDHHLFQIMIEWTSGQYSWPSTISYIYCWFGIISKFLAYADDFSLILTTKSLGDCVDSAEMLKNDLLKVKFGEICWEWKWMHWRLNHLLSAVHKLLTHFTLILRLVGRNWKILMQWNFLVSALSPILHL